MERLAQSLQVLPRDRAEQFTDAFTQLMAEDRPSMAEPEKLLTPEEAATRLNVSPRAVREWLRQGKLRGVKVGRLLRVPESAIAEFLKPTGPQAPPVKPQG
jgi:excisionase family DNA binding protein